MKPVPLVDLKSQHLQIKDEVANGWSKVLNNTNFILGEEVFSFEQKFADFMKVKFAVGVANGTDALELALRAAEIGHGDEVIVPANTFIASAFAIARAGARPVLVDCDPEYQLIDPRAVEQAVTKRTKAIMPVHLFGQMAPMKPLKQIASSKKLKIVEDVAQAQGASQLNQSAGSIGAISGTSFYPGKNIGAYGDGGAVLTNSKKLADAVKIIRDCGSDRKYHHPKMGVNSRLDTLQAVVLTAKLSHLKQWNKARAQAAKRYHSLFKLDKNIQLPATYPGNTHVWHLYVVRVDKRDRVLKKLHAANVGAGIHYPIPIHMQGAFQYLGHKIGDFPNAEKAANEILSLPLYPHINPKQQEHVAKQLLLALH